MNYKKNEINKSQSYKKWFKKGEKLKKKKIKIMKIV